MALPEIFIFTLFALVYRFTARSSARGWLLLVGSTLAIFWLQPATPIRFLDFWLPVATLALTIFSWLLSAERDQKRNRENWLTAGVIGGIVLLLALTRYVSMDGILTVNRPPQTLQVLLGLAGLALLGWLLGRFSNAKSAWLGAGMLFLLALFLVLKLPQLSLSASIGLRSLVGQGTATATALDIRWLGFSYVAFRLIHTLRDRQGGRLANVSLQEYVNYVIFFPAFTAGPIDRLPRFTKDLQKPLINSVEEFGVAFYRLTIGIFKKFAIADTLALIALNGTNAGQLQTAGWSWIVVYAYAFQIFFDFSGYTDIAIGLGRLLGIQLPENFNQPYRRTNLTLFWNNWHMTLTQWFRAYFFNPFTRSLRTRYKNLAPGWVILITQVSTMVLIGLWHGVTWNFVVWGIWHGLGLFVQNRFSDWMKPRTAAIQSRPRLSKALDILNTLFTFHFVVLGWVWFALPSASLSWQVILRLFGLGG
ncbi:MAG: hypothetical protein CVU39_08130 [Chloroflexi bacterium HGW-Chloroflexi-10]|nr:MAG: hypothetical protein CVU39_08130 [Chloroflexi bacterium HGW-Chloroflexi-10]